MKPRVYLETTIVSYQTSRPSRDLVVAAHQQVTQEWWNRRITDFSLYVSELVLEEAAKGDPGAARRRLDLLKSVGVLAIDEEALALAQTIVNSGCMPETAGADALHVAIAAVNGMDYLLTWNCTHINNAEILTKLERACSNSGYRCPVVCTPEQLLGE
ncbi:MAG: type II toxin-antitoxin system VapC family toxin [Acidobacteriota bacterium]